MMNTVTFLLLVAFTLLNAEVRAQINDSANHGLMLLTTKKNENMNSVQGSPYLDGDFQRGTVMIERAFGGFLKVQCASGKDRN